MASGIDRRRFHAWVHRQIFVESSDRGNCVKFTLKQVKANNSIGQEIGTIAVAGKVGEDDVSQYVNDIDMMSNNDAAGIGGMNRYVVLPSFESEAEDAEGNVKKEVVVGGRFTFRVYGGDEDKEEGGEEGVGPTESATPTGLLVQLMRHNENTARIGAASTAQIITTLQRENARLSDMVETMQAKHIELIDTLESLKDKRHERDLSAKVSMVKQDAIRDLANKGMQLAPILVNAMAKKRLLPAKVTATESLLHSFMTSIKPEQFDGFLGIMTEEQRIVLMTLYQDMHKLEPEANGLGDGNASNGSNGAS